MSILKNKAGKFGKKWYPSGGDEPEVSETEVQNKIKGFAKLLDLTVDELYELVPIEDDYDYVAEMFKYAIIYREERRQKREGSYNRRRSSK